MATASSSQDGYTIVEVVVATAVLLVGMLGVLGLLSGALRATATTNERVAATSLARELVETARALDYDDMTSGVVAARLQARGLGTGSPWTITRRNVAYTVTASTCSFDDPADGWASSPPPNACATRPAGSDPNGDDFRRTTFTLAWRDPRGAQRTMSQSTLVINPSGGLGPRISCLTPVAQTFAPSPPALAQGCPAAGAVASDATTVRIVWTTTPAQAMSWQADDGSSRGELTPTPNASGGSTFTLAWNVGDAVAGSGTEILDGSYAITARAFDVRGIAGEVKRADVVLNRRAPYPPPSLQGGHNSRLGGLVDLHWGLNSERDVLGYRVIWAGPDGASGGGNDQQVCPAPSAGSYLAPTTQSCADFSPPTGATGYYVVAVDRAPDGSLRQGAPRALTIGAPSVPPLPPLGLTVATSAEGSPRLSWTAPVGGGVAFYRIYRDDSDGNPATVAYADRLDRTSTAVTSYTDSQAGTIARLYWVTAVDSSYNESAPLGPIVWPGL